MKGLAVLALAALAAPLVFAQSASQTTGSTDVRQVKTEHLASPGAAAAARYEASSAPPLKPAVEDPCASVMAELDAEREARSAQAQEIEKLQLELRDVWSRSRWLDRELLLATMGTGSNGDTPLGAFLRTEEALAIIELEVRQDRQDKPLLLRAVCAYLELFPVYLRPGEGMWVAEYT